MVSNYTVNARSLAARYSLLVVVVVEYLVFATVKPAAFFSTRTLTTVLGVQAPLLMLALGLTITLIIGEFDLSIGATLVFSNVVIVSLHSLHSVPIFIAVLCGLIVGALIGLVNAFLVVSLGLNSFIATLGVATGLAGLSQLLSGSTILSNVPKTLSRVISTNVFGLPLALYYAFLAAGVLWYLYRYRPFGRYLYFIGDNVEVARLAGVPVSKVRYSAFVIGGGIAGLAGLMQTGTIGAADPSAGMAFLLPAFAAAFLGQTAVQLGRFNVWGTIIASYFLVTGVTGLAILGLTGWVQDVFNGGALLAALIAARIARRKQ